MSAVEENIRESVSEPPAAALSAPPAPSLAVIVPVYNEDRTVAELLRRLEAQPCVSQIIIVDDGSADRTWEELEPWRAKAGFESPGCSTLAPSSRMPALKDQFADQATESSAAKHASPLADELSIIVLRHDRNRGKGRAIRTGLDHVTCSHVIIQDADLEYDPADINKLWAVMLEGKTDVVFGSRYLEDPKLQRGRYIMQLGVRLLNLMMRLFYGVTLTDEATGYKMFRSVSLRVMDLTCERFEFCAEVAVKAAKMKLSIREVPVSYRHRTRHDGKKLRLLDGVVAVRTICGITLPSRTCLILGVLLVIPFSWIGLWEYRHHSLREVGGQRDEMNQQGSIFLPDVIYNCGRVPIGAVASHSFSIENVTANPVALEEVKISKSCGCTSATLENVEPIQPGESALVEVTVKTDQKEGVFKESVLVQLSGHTARCGLTGIAFPAISAEPSDVAIVVNGHNEREAKTEVALGSELPLNWSRMEVAVPWPELTWELKGVEEETCHLSLSYPPIERNLRLRHSGPLVITVPHVTSGAPYLCKLRVSIVPHESLEIIPAVVSASTSVKKDSSVFRFFVKGNAALSLTGESVSIDSEEARFQVVGVEKMTERLWRVEAEGSKCSSKKIEATIRVGGDAVSAVFLVPN